MSPLTFNTSKVNKSVVISDTFEVYIIYIKLLKSVLSDTFEVWHLTPQKCKPVNQNMLFNIQNPDVTLISITVVVFRS